MLSERPVRLCQCPSGGHRGRRRRRSGGGGGLRGRVRLRSAPNSFCVGARRSARRQTRAQTQIQKTSLR